MADVMGAFMIAPDKYMGKIFFQKELLNILNKNFQK